MSFSMDPLSGATLVGESVLVVMIVFELVSVGFSVGFTSTPIAFLGIGTVAAFGGNNDPLVKRFSIISSDSLV